VFFDFVDLYDLPAVALDRNRPISAVALRRPRSIHSSDPKGLRVIADFLGLPFDDRAFRNRHVDRRQWAAGRKMPESDRVRRESPVR
jgi:hypothetical protein